MVPVESLRDDPRILMMQPDVKFFLHSASGLLEPRADWTDRARRNLVSATEAYAEARGADVVVVDESDAGSDLEVAYDRLHGAVGSSVLVHHYVRKLPTKGGAFDWSLGPDIAALGAKYDADYALFTFYRDIEATGGRWTMSIVAAAVFGVIPATEAQFGFASLVDLQSGDVIWFNRVNLGSGDLRQPTGATSVVGQLFSQMPRAR
jgi:hypothetical protein